MSWQGDWADWAGDNPVEAERELAREREHYSCAVIKGYTMDPEPEAQDACGHTEVYATGHCAECGEPVPGFEPTDAQIFACYGQTKEVA